MRVPPAQAMPQIQEPVDDVFFDMALVQEAEAMRIPTQGQQPDVPTDHPDFDYQIEAYFTHKQIKEYNKDAAKWRTPVRGEVQN